MTQVQMVGRKSKRTIAVTLLTMVLLCAMATLAAADYTTTRYISTGQEMEFLLHGTDGETAIVYYYPNEAGTRKFEAWHTTPIYWDKCAGMTFSWTNDDGQTWHKWRNAAVGFYWPKTKQDLYSGSSNIGYKFEFKIPPRMCHDAPGVDCSPPHALNIKMRIK